MLKAIKTRQKQDRETLFGSDERLHQGLMKELKVTEQYVKDGIKILLDWYGKQEHLPKYVLDFDFVEGMFSNCKFSIEKTKEKLDCYLTARNVIPEFFKDRDPKSQSILNAKTYSRSIIMPKMTPEEHRVLYISYLGEDSYGYNCAEGFKLLFMLCDMRMFYDECSSVIFIWDMANFNFGHVSNVTPTIVKKAASIFQNAYNQRVHAMHVINIHKYAVSLVKLIKSSLSEKLSKRIHIHSKNDDLFKYIPKDCLPSNIGGTGPSSEQVFDDFYKVICSDEWRAWYAHSGEELVDEKKRVKENNAFDDITGMSGTFRKLDLD